MSGGLEGHPNVQLVVARIPPRVRGSRRDDGFLPKRQPVYLSIDLRSQSPSHDAKALRLQQMDMLGRPHPAGAKKNVYFQEPPISIGFRLAEKNALPRKWDYLTHRLPAP